MVSLAIQIYLQTKLYTLDGWFLRRESARTSKFDFCFTFHTRLVRKKSENHNNVNVNIKLIIIVQDGLMVYINVCVFLYTYCIVRSKSNLIESSERGQAHDLV